MDDAAAADVKVRADRSADLAQVADSASPASPLPDPYGISYLLAADRWRTSLRFVIAVAGAGVICLVLRVVASPTLTGQIDIVGYPTFFDYNFRRLFWSYRLIVYAFPFLAVVGYAVLARFGPLRSHRPRPAPGPIALTEPAVAVPADATRPGWGLVPRLLVPAGLVAVAAGARTGRTDPLSVGWGMLYLIAILGLSELWVRRGNADRWRTLSLVNGAGGAVAAVLALWFVSAHTVVVAADGPRTWSWLPWWLAVLGVAAIGYWSWRQYRRGRSARETERTLLTVVVGTIGIFLATSVLPGQVATYAGYDDGLEMAGASLLNRGYVPWRDLFSIHGVFPDVLVGRLGQVVFGDSIWGIFAIHGVILTPLCWVTAYLFAAWVSRRNPWLLAGLVFVGFSGFLAMQTAERFVAIPLVLILLGETLRRRSPGWAVGLVSLVFVQAILVPETSFLAAPVLACVVGAELVHRRPGERIWTGLRLTRWSIVTGVVALVLWTVFLVSVGALRAFIDYYVVFGPGHNEAGAINPTGIRLRERAMFATGVVCVLLTVWAVAIKVARRLDWQARDWVAVAAAIFVALYTEKALGRLDYAHVWQVFGAGLPLALLWSARGIDAATRIGAQWRAEGRTRPAAVVRLRLVQVGAVVAVLAMLAAFHHPLIKAASKLDRLHRVDSATEASYPRIGYATPGAVDLGLLQDLDTTLRAYAGDHGAVFDMTNSVGYFTYLLGRDPGTRFAPVSMAIPPYAQQLVIAELSRSRPPVVVYDATSIGLPAWDGAANDVRHYEISQFVLRGWTPVLRTHGVLIMVRNDLVTKGLPLPTLLTVPETTNLYFNTRDCDWGAAATFLRPVATGTPLTVPLVASATQVTGDERGSVTRTISRIALPAGITLRDYELAVLSTNGPAIGSARLSISDNPSPYHAILATALPSVGASLSLRVGSCRQWYGYDPARPIYVIQDGGVPVTSITLSAVQD